MATDPLGAQRIYRAPCPGCGAPVAFRSAQSTHAVCSFCQSTVARQGEVLSRLGKMGELFDDHSPLQLMVSGRHVEGGRNLPFTLVGRLQYQASTGVWTEWHAVLPDGTSASLSEDNGGYVFTQSGAVTTALPGADALRVGGGVVVDGTTFTTTFVEQVALRAAEGEVPRLPPVGTPFTVAELRNASGEVLSLEYLPGSARPLTARGRAVRLEDLELKGLRDGAATKDETGRAFSCPNCAAPVTVTLASTKRITCGSCRSIINVESGVGGELRHAQQGEPVAPVIPLGSIGQMQGVPWQVVGFQHRMGEVPGEDGDEAEHFGWSEYLLYNATRGFTFLVDAEDGWSVVQPATGAPTVGSGGESATYRGTRYALQYRYTARTTYVAGEFYWPVARGQITDNRDYAAGRQLLSMEKTQTEVTWSAGTKLEAATVAKAFKLQGREADLKRDDVAPVNLKSTLGCGTIVLLVIVLIVILLLLSTCSRSTGGYRSSGGSYGGYSSGGGHK